MGQSLQFRRGQSKAGIFSDRIASWVIWAVLLSLVGHLGPCSGVAHGQTSVVTWHYDNARTSANSTEFLLTPANVGFKTFGKLFAQPVDGFVVGHPLYLPKITVAGNIHNAVYVATMHDTVYAFDADTPNASPLWSTSLLSYSPAGATPVPVSVKGGAGTTAFTEVGVVSTPVIDPSTGTMYLVAETYENGNVVHRLHALDVTSGVEKLGGPTTISASYTLNGTTYQFLDLQQMNRPGLLLTNGHVYIAFGGDGINGNEQGWVLSYNATTLQQEGAYDDEPGAFNAAIWQKGAGLSADSSGNIYAETGDGQFVAGTNFGTSVLKLSQTSTTLSVADWFTPYNWQVLMSKDLDLSDGVLILPDQPGPIPHELIAVGKEGTIYLLNQDTMGQFCSACTSGDTQIVQELPHAAPFTGTPVYWNNQVFFDPRSSPLQSYSLSNGLLVSPPAKSPTNIAGAGHAILTANGNTNGVLWTINGTQMSAIDAATLATLYTTAQAPNGRDTLPSLAHFATPIAADGKVFVATRTSLVIYGLLPILSASAGNNQSGVVASTLPLSLTVQATDPYSSSSPTGVAVTFSDGGKGGTFGSSTVLTDNTGMATTTYKLPTKSGTYTITATATGYSPASFTETATPGPPVAVVRYSGNLQSTPILTAFPKPLVAKARDQYNNGVPGVVVSFGDKAAGGTFSANPVTTGSTGLASVIYTTATKAGTLAITASAPGLTSTSFSETVTAGAPATIAVISGDNQTAPVSTQLAQALVVKVTDQYGNAVSGASVNFDDGGAGGSFSANPVLTASNGTASVNYTTPPGTGSVGISATVSGVSTPATFTVTVQ